MATTNVNPGTSSQCKVCQKPASKRCARCAEGLDIDGALAQTFYCSAACQKADWTSSHKAACSNANARKQLYRGGELLQRVWYAFREVAFDLEICDIQKKGNDIHLYDPATGFQNGPLFPFPNSDSLTTDDKHAILTFLACGDGIAYLHELAQKVMEDIGSTEQPLTEISTSMKGTTRTVWHHGLNGVTRNNQAFRHQFLQAQLKNGETYAIDMSGAQYGLYNAVAPMQKYRAQHIDFRKFGVRAFGHAKGDIQKLLTGDKSVCTPTTDQRVCVMHIEAAKALNHAVGMWEDGGIKVVKLLNAPQAKFETLTKTFVETLTMRMEGCIAYLQTREADLWEVLTTPNTPGEGPSGSDIPGTVSPAEAADADNATISQEEWGNDTNGMIHSLVSQFEGADITCYSADGHGGVVRVNIG